MPEKAIEQWLYHGNVVLKGGTVGHAFEVLGADGKERTGEMVYFSFRRPLAVGAVYNVPVTRTEGGTSITSKEMAFAKYYPDATLVATLQAEQMAFEQQRKEAALEKKYLVDSKNLPKTLQEVAALYANMDYGKKVAFEGVILAHIRKLARQLERQKRQ